MSRYRAWKLRRRLRGRAHVLALLATDGHDVIDTDRLERLFYEELCRDHAVTP